MIFIFIAFSLSYLPHKYRVLVKEALKSAEKKIPLELREDTKYPGYYESQHYHFTLLKTLTSKTTKDIKGFAFNERSCAIVKRKSFNISGDFAIVDEETQKIFLVNDPIASEENVDVFDFKPLNIFSIMTNFKLETSTEEEINNLPLNSAHRSRRPKVEFDINKKWDDSKDRPVLQKISDDNDVQVGIGARLKMGATLTCRFKSIWDVSVTFRLNIDGKLGAEILIPDNTKFKYDGKELYNIHIPIPKLGYETKFLGIQISVGAFINIAFDLLDVEITIPVEIDYFKGYHFQASKYFQITPTSVSDSSWDISMNELPQADSIKDVFKALLQSTLKATLQIRPFFSLELNIGDLETQLHAGLKFPFVFLFTHDTDLCKYPHIKCDVTIPMKVFCAFTGIKYKDMTIIKSYEQEKVFKKLELPSFCIGGKKFNSGSQTSALIGYQITNDNFYEELTPQTVHVKKHVKVCMKYNDSKYESDNPFDLYLSPIMNLNSQISKNNQYTFFCSRESIQKEINWSLLYYDSDYNLIESDDAFDKSITDLSSKKSFNVELKKSQNDNSDLTHFTTTIEKTPVYYEWQKYTRKSQNEYVYITGYINNYSLFVIDQNGSRYVDNDCIITPYNLIDDQQAENSKPGIIENVNYEYRCSITSSDIKENNVHVLMEIYEKIIVNGNEKNILITSFITPALNIGDKYTRNGFPHIHFNYGDKLYIKGKIYKSDHTEEDFITSESFTFNGESKAVFTFILNDNLQFTFSFSAIAPLVRVQTSVTNPYPLIEKVIQVVNMKDFIISENTSIYEAQFRLSAYDEYVILRFDIPEEHRNRKLLIISYGLFESFYQVLTFIDDKCLLLNENHAIIDIQGNEVIDVLMKRNSQISVAFQFRYMYITTPEAGLVISESGYSFKLITTAATAFLIPFFNGKTSYGMLFPGLNDGDLIYVARYRSLINDFAFFTFTNMENTSVDCTIYIMTTGIGDLEPNVTINFASYQPYLDRYHYFEFEVSTSNGFRIECEINGKKMHSDLVNQSARFNITDVSKPITFSSICSNSTERACLIEYPVPNETGYHLLRYPNRDGISITGRGFLSEFIYVEKGKSFFYSKTYLGEIEKLREYSLTDQVSVKIKITDNKTDNYKITQNYHQNLLLQDDDAIYLYKTRKICLVDKSNDDILPFSRKNFDENLFDMLDRLGIDSNGDLSKLTNDENGCLVFDSKLIKSNKFDRLTNDFCDLPLASDIKDVDKSDIIFKEDGLSKSDKIKRILILVAIIVVCLIIIIVIIVCCIKKRCCCCCCCGDGGGIDDFSP